MKERPTPIAAMLAELEAKFYLVTPILGGTKKRIDCRHCPLAMEFDDADHEQASQAAIAFLAHLKKRHPKLLSEPMKVMIDKL